MLDDLSVETGDTTLASTSFTHATPSGSDRLLLVSASWDDANDANLSSITYNGTGLTCLEPAKQADKIASQMCYLVAPPTGSHTLALDWALDVPEWAVVARSLTDVDQSNPLGATSLDVGNGTSAVDTLTTEEPDSAVFAHLGTEDASVSLEPVNDTVEDHETSVGLASLGISAAAGRVNTTTAGTYEVGWDLSGEAAWALDLIELRRSPERVYFNASTDSGEESASPATIGISMDRTSSGDVEVDYEITGGDASSEDHNLSGGRATIEAGETWTTVDLDITDDDMDEPDETIEVTLKNPRGGKTSIPTTFTYTILDDDANQAPDPDDASVSTDEDTDLSDTVTASDPDQNDTIDSFAVDTGPSHGSLTFDTATGAYTYSPAADYEGSDSFTFTATDEHGATSTTATVNISVDSVNDAPSAIDDSATADEDEAVWVDVLGNDDDVDGDTLSVDATTVPGNGSTSVPGNGTVKYTPDADWNGEDAFTYNVTDGASTDAATVTVTVNAVNDAPIAFDDAASTRENETVWVDVLANDTDVDDGSLSVADASAPANGSTSVPGNGTVKYTPDAGFGGLDSFAYNVSDGSLTAQARVDVSVVEADGGGGGAGAEILSSNVRILEGSLDSDPTLRTQAQVASISIQLENGTGGIDLAELGATNETTVEINLTARNFTPTTLMGRTQVVDWSNTTNANGTENVSLELRPIAMAFLDDCQMYPSFMGYCGPSSTDSWPTDEAADQADVSFEAGLRVFLSDLSYLNETMQDRMQGAYMTTDAQALGQMNVSGADEPGGPSLTMPVAGPHTLPDGTQNDGFFEARIPDGMLNWWGLDQPSRLTGSYEGENRSVEITDVTEGTQLRMDIHYSSGEVNITEDTTAPSADAGPDQTVTEGDSLTLDASNSTDNQAIANYTWTLDDGTTVYGETVEHTYADDGTYRVVLNVTDGNDNVDEDIVNVTVEASSSGGGGGAANPLGGGGSSDDGDDNDQADETVSTDEDAEAAEDTDASASGGSGGGGGAGEDSEALSTSEAETIPKNAGASSERSSAGDDAADGEAESSGSVRGARIADQGAEIGAWLVWLVIVPLSVVGIRRYA